MKFIFVLLFIIPFIQCYHYSDQLSIKDRIYESFVSKIFTRKGNEKNDIRDEEEKINLAEILQNVLKSCDQSLSEAERRIGLALNQIDIYDGKLNFIDDFLMSLHSNEAFNLTSWKSSTTISHEDVHHKYLTLLKELLDTIKEACSTLPLAITRENIFNSDKNEILVSLINWSIKWFRSIEVRMTVFYEKCESNDKCNKFLNKFINFSIFILEKKDLSDLNETLKGVLDFLETDAYFGQNGREFMELWYQLLDPNKKVLNPYWLTERLAYKDRKDVQKLILNKQTVAIINGYLEIDTDILVHEVPKEFLSVAFGSNLIKEHFRDMPSNKHRLINLTLPLQPLYVRMGGSESNFLTYGGPLSETESFPKMKGWSYNEKRRSKIFHPKLSNVVERKIIGCEMPKETDYRNYTMTGTEWRFLVDFIKEIKSVLIFDLNQFQRDESGMWNATNARLLMLDEATQNIPVIWQLGNEPNSYRHAFGWDATPEEIATDFRSLRKEVDELYPNRKNFVVGPDLTRPRRIKQKEMLGKDSIQFMSIFLKNAVDAVDFVSWHHYYINGHTSNVSDFTSIKNMNLLSRQLKSMVHVSDKWAPGKPVWLTETATASGGGDHPLSMSFASTFLWLDKLGSSAFAGISMVYKETLYGGCYGLLDTKFRPTPNYWVSLLHKQLVGQKVLLPRVRLSPKGVRIYAHCMNDKHELYEKGAVVVFGINVSKNVGILKLSDDVQRNSSIYEFKLSAPLAQLDSRFTLLNGEILEVNETGIVPVLYATSVPSGQLVFPPQSLVFYALPQAQIRFC